MTVDPRDLVFVQTLVDTVDRQVDVVRDKDGVLYVRKFVRRVTPRSWRQALREIETMRAVSSVEGVLPIEYSALRESSLVLVIPYCEMGDAHDYVTNNDLTNKEIAQIFYLTAATVDRIHRKGVAHRDVKLENILLRKATREGFCFDVFLSDFGLAVCSLGMQTSSLGTLTYAAPEIWISTRPDCYDPFKADVWSLGVCLFALMTRSLPFFGKTKYELERSILVYEHTWYEGGKEEHAPFYLLLRSMLCVNPADRIGLTEILSNRYLRSFIPKDMVPELDLDGLAFRSSSTGELFKQERDFAHLNSSSSDDMQPGHTKKKRRASPREFFVRVMDTVRRR